jgi:hypothetical protein
VSALTIIVVIIVVVVVVFVIFTSFVSSRSVRSSATRVAIPSWRHVMSTWTWRLAWVCRNQWWWQFLVTEVGFDDSKLLSSDAARVVTAFIDLTQLCHRANDLAALTASPLSLTRPVDVCLSQGESPSLLPLRLDTWLSHGECVSPLMLLGLVARLHGECVSPLMLLGLVARLRNRKRLLAVNLCVRCVEIFGVRSSVGLTRVALRSFGCAAIRLSGRVVVLSVAIPPVL